MRRPRRLLAALLPLLLCAAGARGDAIDDYLRDRIQALHIPGLSLAVVRDGKVVKTEGYGSADLQNGVPATAGTVYEIGSMTKQLTAALVMMLVEEGKLRLDQPITDFFPDAPPWWRKITIRNLLGHTGGIQNHVAVPGYLRVFTIDPFFGPAPSVDDLRARFYQLPEEFEPGATWSYDNTGYILLGWILERASGKPYFQLLDERIFAPLGMHDSRSTDPRPVIARRAAGYGWVNGAFENRAVLWPHVAFSAGSVLSTVGDLARWDAALRGDALLRPASKAAMWTPATASDGSPLPFDYGFGWFVDAYHGHRLVQHSGGTGGFSSVSYRYVDDGLTVIMLTNHEDMVLDELAVDVAGMVEPKLRRPEGVTDPDPATTAKLRALLAGLLAGKVDPAQLSAPMVVFLGTATGKGLWRDWISSHGELGAFDYSDSEPRGSDRVMRYAVMLGANRYWISFRVAPDGRVAQITWW